MSKKKPKLKSQIINTLILRPFQPSKIERWDSDVLIIEKSEGKNEDLSMKTEHNTFKLIGLLSYALRYYLHFSTDKC